MRKLGVKPRGDSAHEISLLLPNGSRIVGVPGVESTVRGFSAVSLVIFDEAARVSEEQYFSIRPMIAVSGGDLWMMSTPCGKRGFFHAACTQGNGMWERLTVKATECPRIPESFLEEERQTMGERRFSQEYLCEFGEAEDSVFSEEMILGSLRDDWIWDSGATIRPWPRWRRARIFWARTW